MGAARSIASQTRSWAAALGARATTALLDEARLTPKPGLVDGRGSGAHADLDLALMCESALALEPWFLAIAEAGEGAGAATLALRETLGRLGREAEAVMLRTTGGVNTHRGAIWAVGLLVAAAAIDARAGVESAVVRSESESDFESESELSPSVRIARLAGRIARLPDCHAPRHTGHKGERACRDYGVSGARGQAQSGFPAVITCALPELRLSRRRGDSETSARLNALLALMSCLDDTCVLSRAGVEGLRRLQTGAAAVLAAGGAASLAGRSRLRRLDAEALAAKASPGGAADLLAATLFLDGLEGLSHAEA